MWLPLRFLFAVFFFSPLNVFGYTHTPPRDTYKVSNVIYVLAGRGSSNKLYSEGKKKKEKSGTAAGMYFRLFLLPPQLSAQPRRNEGVNLVSLLFPSRRCATKQKYPSELKFKKKTVRQETLYYNAAV